MHLSDRIITYIQNHYPITLDRLTEVAMKKGFTELEVLSAMDTVHRDKSVIQSVRRGVIEYRPYVKPPVAPVATHLSWWNKNYPRMDESNDGSGIDIDLSHLFLDPQAMKEYKIKLKGGFIPKVFTTKKRSS